MAGAEIERLGGGERAGVCVGLYQTHHSAGGSQFAQLRAARRRRPRLAIRIGSKAQIRAFDCLFTYRRGLGDRMCAATAAAAAAARTCATSAAARASGPIRRNRRNYHYRRAPASTRVVARPNLDQSARDKQQQRGDDDDASHKCRLAPVCVDD